MTADINPEMIILAREARGLTQAELADKIGMSATNLSKIERKEIGVQRGFADTLSEKMDFPPHFFLQDGEPVPENLNYRKRETVAQKLITPIHAQVNIIRRHVQFLTRALDIPTPTVPVMEVSEKQDPQQIAAAIRKEWEIASPVIESLTNLLEAKGIFVSSFPFGTERVDSRSILTDEKHPIIFVNQTSPGDRQRFSLAYELGQLVMHTFCAVNPERDISHEANVFAAEFLMPAEYIREDFSHGITIPILGELKRKWKVSMIALLYRADDLGFVTANQKRYLIQQFNTLNIRRREPIELDVTREEPKLIKQLIAKYRAKTKLGTAELAALFCLNIDEFIEMYS